MEFRWHLDRPGPPGGPGNNVTITLNKTTGGVLTQTLLGTVPVDAVGAWTLGDSSREAAHG